MHTRLFAMFSLGVFCSLSRFNARLTEILYELLVDGIHTMPNLGDDAYVSCLSRRTQFQGYVPRWEAAEDVAPSIPLLP